MGGQEGLVVVPTFLAAFESHKQFYSRKFASNAIDGIQIIAVSAHHACATVIDDVGKIGRRQPEVDRHDDGADLRHGVVALQMAMCVGGNVGHPVARLNAKGLQGGRPAIAALEELGIGEAQITVNNGLAAAV